MVIFEGHGFPTTNNGSIVRGIPSPQDYHSKKIIKSAPKKSLLIIWRDQLGAETPQTRI
jgi:hypothetical protein